jgi:translation elongation factor EF-G
MKSSYRLVQPVSTEYAWKLLIPFNYAGVTLTLKPNVNEGRFLELALPGDQIWTLRNAVESNNDVIPEEMKRRINPAIDYLAGGIEKGAREVLASALDYPIEQVTVVVEKTVVDVNHSTFKAFEFATKKAIQNIIEKANAKGLLVISEV